MFKHILLPIDDSAASRRVVRKAIALARETGAQVTGYHALRRTPGGVYGEGYRFSAPEPGTELKSRVRAARSGLIAAAAEEARRAGVRFDSLVNQVSSADSGIVEAARKRKCDVIVMGTSGRRGLSRLALGSVASGVLTRSNVPVLVYRRA